MILVNSIGEEVDVDLDIDRIIAYETEHPDWSIQEALENADKMRFSDMDVLARMVGYDNIKVFFGQGFSISDLYEVYQNSKYLGFSEQD